MQTKLTIRRFTDPGKAIPNSVSRPLTIVTQEDKQTWVKTLYKQGWKDTTKHELIEISKLPSIEEIAVVITKNILVIDFDTNKSYEDAIKIDTLLPTSQQCKLIVHSNRKGGHFYYSSQQPEEQAQTDKISPLHSGKEVTTLDILTGEGHNVFAPTKGDASKSIQHNKQPLTPIPDIMVYYVNSIILSEATPKNKAIYLTSKEGYSDDNFNLIENYILHKEPTNFLQYYSLPSKIPPQESWKTLQALAYRLLRDETLTHSNVIATLDIYDPEHRQDHNALAPESENIYIESKRTFSLTLTSRRDNTLVTTYLDKITGNYLVVENTAEKPVVHIVSQESRVKALLESISGKKRSQIPSQRIEAITQIYTYAEKGGLNLTNYTFNTAYTNKYLTAFKGTKPDKYSLPQRLISLLKYMWQDEYEYLLASTQYRLRTFEHSAVVTHIVGGEGSGKGLTVDLLTRAFTEESQELSYELFMDKHSTHQTQPNTVLEEVGEWNPAEQKGALSKIKAMSGSRGKATVRGMHKEAVVVPTINKIWVLGNNWMRLHTDPMTQRRIHAVYMPQSLTRELGGKYSTNELDDILTENNIVNLYYWLGTQFQPEKPFTASEYHSAVSQHNTLSYKTYIENVEGDSDIVIRLITQRKYAELIKALKIAGANLDTIVWKHNKQRLMVVSVTSLKTTFSRLSGAPAIHKALDSVAANFEGNKLLKFKAETSPEKFMTIFDSPPELQTKTKTERLDYE